MTVTNDEFIPGHDPAYLEPKVPFIPWAAVEEAAFRGIESATIDTATAKKLIAERELAYMYNEGFVE